MGKREAARWRARGPGAPGRARGGPARVLVVDPAAPSPRAVVAAVRALRAGELVAFPTDTLYALGADPFRPGALGRVLAAKGRPAAKAVSLLVTGAAMAASLTSAIPPSARALMRRFWPGALTLILPPAPGLPPPLAPPGGGVGLRAPGGGVARALLQSFGGPVVGTSANRTGGPEPQEAEAVLRQLGAHLAVVLDGGTIRGGMPSSVVDCTADPPRLLRAGALSLLALRAACPALRGGARPRPPRARKW